MCHDFALASTESIDSYYLHFTYPSISHLVFIEHSNINPLNITCLVAGFTLSETFKGTQNLKDVNRLPFDKLK